ncbi:hypothetical protein CC86DRAFT_182958 [Ophiobolus disseminans]|uniref:Uncharacterized protein n=1 Tax=Ophiobolus disseminans TaxID=1469910 RepID=A0A6A6ZAK2_9PLEO|nr:hypothetical protein CC86DRAFT_182958 [Ophiobolus disseminans]
MDRHQKLRIQVLVPLGDDHVWLHPFACGNCHCLCLTLLRRTTAEKTSWTLGSVCLSNYDSHGIKWYSILVTSPPKLVYPAWVSIVLAAVLLSFLPRNQHTELICRYCALSLVVLVSAVLFLLLIKANYTALGSLSKKTAVIKYRIFAIFASTIHFLSTTGAIA